PDYVKFNIDTANTENFNSHNPETTNNTNSNKAQSLSKQFVNEFKDYINGRYLSALEAA
ncbi:901_t:CDS:1, partial [Racocetra persica]